VRPQRRLYLCVAVSVFGLAPSPLAGQRGAPALAACSLPNVDTTGWKEFTANIAPVAFRAPADFQEHRFTHVTSFSTGPRNARPRRWAESEHQTWFGQSPPRGLSLTRTKYDSTAHASHPGSPQQRELTYCRDSIGGLAAVIRSDRMVGMLLMGTDTLDAYETAGAFALAPNDTLYVSAGADDPATQAVVLTIIRSVRLRRTVDR
jgi:hypothetical protein